jgi:hypothetical protein
VLHQIGTGSSGPVYRAYEPELDRLVAVKMFRLDATPERLGHFVTELEKLIAADLTHPGIAAPLGTGIVGTSAYLAQDFVAADSLDLSLRNYGPVPLADAVRVAVQVAAALDFAAAVQVVHGALHPRDILISADDTRLTGLGIVQALDAIEASSPLRPAYTAPERAAGDAWDGRADIFSLAAIVHELLWGRPVASSAEETVAALSPIAGGSLEELTIVFGRALADRPGDRYHTADAFADALQRCFPALVAAQYAAGFASVDDDEDDDVVDDSSGRLVLDRGTAEGRADRADERRVMMPRELPFLDSLNEDPDESGFRLSLEGRDPGAIGPPYAREDDHEIAGREAADLDLRGENDVSYQEMEARPAPAPVPDRVGGHTFNQPHSDPASQVSTSAAWALRGSEAPSGAAASPAPPSPVAPPAAGGYAAGSAARFSEYAAERSRSAVWPLVLALAVGLAVGSAATFLLLNRDRGLIAGGATADEAAPSAAQDPASPAGGAAARGGTPPARESTEAAVPAAPAVRAPAPDTRETPPYRNNAPPAARTEPPRAEPARARPQSAPAASRQLLVRSTPAGARVMVDGRSVGVTPVTVSDLQPGSHQVRIVRDGYAAVERRVSLSGSRPAQSIAVNLSRTPAAGAAAAPATPRSLGRTVGALFVDSRPPAANVFVDGKLVGTTPLQLDTIDAGPHVVRLEREGYGAWSTSIRVTGGERARVSASLER